MRKRRYRARLLFVAFAVLVVVAALAACGDDPDDARPAPPPDPGRESPAAGHRWGRFPTFTDVARESGLAAHICHAGTTGDQNWVLQAIGSGAVALDHDGDGDMDLLLVDGDGMDVNGDIVHEEDARTRLWRNDGVKDGIPRFTDVTTQAGIDITGYGLGGAAADYDGDGLVDFAVTGYGFMRLYRNLGGGTFRDVTEAAGLPARAPDTDTWSSCSWGDLDGDGRLDLFVTAYADQRYMILSLRAAGLKPRSCRRFDTLVYCGPRELKHGQNRVFFQQADHTFVDRTEEALVAKDSYSLQALLTDVDADGDLDVYVANDSEDNHLLVNDGKGRLVDHAVEAGVATDRNFQPQASMGLDAADWDRDGDLDLFVTNFVHEYNALHRNDSRAAGVPFFTDVSHMVGTTAGAGDRVCWGTKLVDFDGDTVLDVFVACGHVYREEERTTGGAVGNSQRCLLLRGRGPPRYEFVDVTDEGGAPFEQRRLWRGAAFADYDDDGDWDVLVTAQRDVPALLRNDGGNTNGWVRFDLRGRPPLTTPAGARVRVTLDAGDASTVLLAELHCGSSYAGSDDPRMLFGVGDRARVPLVEVRWPDGSVTKLTDVETRKTHVVQQR